MQQELRTEANEGADKTVRDEGVSEGRRVNVGEMEREERRRGVRGTSSKCRRDGKRREMKGCQRDVE